MGNIISNVIGIILALSPIAYVLIAWIRLINQHEKLCKIQEQNRANAYELAQKIEIEKFRKQRIDAIKIIESANALLETNINSKT